MTNAKHGTEPALTERLAGWGNYPVEECAVLRPERLADLEQLVSAAPHASLIARGLGRSYGDAALNGQGAVVLSERLNRFLCFDPQTGELRCEAAVSLAEIIDCFLPRGFFFPVTPGSKFITVGGAIAADVHGKNHHRSGSMSAFVLDFLLVTASGTRTLCSRDENPELFWATLGGMGLTGFITEARLQLRRVESAYMRVDYEKARDLDVVLERCADSDDDYDYGVAWIDCLARGRSLGRSVLMRANHAASAELPAEARSAPLHAPSPRTIGVPFTLPNVTLNPLSVRAFNAAFYRTHRTGRRIVDCDRYFYPLDSVRSWNRVYGRRGMLQYQVALPRETCREALIEILDFFTSGRRASFLAVIKSFGPASQGLLSFPRAGFTLSLDLPNTGEELIRSLRQLDRRVVRHGGRVYLAKDACCEPELLPEMYPELERFRAIQTQVDPQHRFASSLSRRLGITPTA